MRLLMMFLVLESKKYMTIGFKTPFAVAHIAQKASKAGDTVLFVVISIKILMQKVVQHVYVFRVQCT